jgi:hypothetical protein
MTASLITVTGLVAFLSIIVVIVPTAHIIISILLLLLNPSSPSSLA